MVFWCCRAHLDISEDDPHVGETFSVETLRQGDNGMRTIPSSVHGAPTSTEVGLGQRGFAKRLMLCISGNSLSNRRDVDVTQFGFPAGQTQQFWKRYPCSCGGGGALLVATLKYFQQP
jgi:hypothetical protein